MSQGNSEGTATSNDSVASVRAELAEMDASKALLSALDPISSRIDAVAEANSASLSEKLGPAFLPVRDHAVALRTTLQSSVAEIERIRADKSKSELGKRDEIAKVLAKRDEAIARHDSATEATLSSVLTGYSERSWPAPTSEIVQEAGLVMSRFPLASAGAFNREAADVLRRASDPTTPAPEQFRLNQLLVHAYAPLLERRATSPEKFARNLAPVADALHGTIQRHLRNVTGADMAEGARRVADTLRVELNFVKREVARTGGFDEFIISIGAPTLFGKGR